MANTGTQSLVVISIQTTDGDHPERRRALADWLITQFRELDRRGIMFSGLDDEMIKNTAIAFLLEER